MSQGWLLVGVIVATTAAGEVLQTIGMKKHGEVRDFRPGALGRTAAALARNWYVPVSILFLTVSFFAFLQLLAVTDLSFAVPATAASLVIETLLAKYLLRESVSGVRWAGTLLVASGVALLAL
jgi:multidrug transporter EmrE-like cation transporter